MRALLALSLLLTGCPRPVCSTMATRCDGARAEVCAADGQWQVVEDCEAVARQSGGEWTCAPVEDEGEAMHACVPMDQPVIQADQPVIQVPAEEAR